MARKTTPQFADETLEDDEDTVVYEPATVVNDDLVSVRIKGTWLMHWGNMKFDFKDGNRYRIPRDLFHYLKKHGNVYDTMA